MMNIFDTSKVLTPDVKWLLDVMDFHGHDSRLVGGCVRDAVLSITPKDIDIATTALPEQVRDLFRNTYGLNVIETGLQHGTVTVVYKGENYEITTLRIDVETDGRHAEVVYTTDWKLDAARRDFTMNAMSMDRHGKLYDYFGGVNDLRAGRVIFVGDPVERMEEDYLRILRYFRFCARFGFTTFDRELLVLIGQNARGLKRISGERIWAELSKTLTYRDADIVFLMMYECGVLQVLGLNSNTSDAPVGMFGVEEFSVIGRLISFYTQTKSDLETLDWIEHVMVERFKVSADERKMFNLYARLIKKYYKAHGYAGKRRTDVLEDIYDYGRTVMNEVFTLARAHTRFVRAVAEFPEGKFPVSGTDLLNLGMKPGPEFGQVLKTLKRRWLSVDKSMSKDDLLAEVKSLKGS